MSDPSEPAGGSGIPDPDEARTARIEFGRAAAGPPNTPWSAPQSGGKPPGSQPLRDSPPPQAGPRSPYASQPGRPRRRHRFMQLALCAVLVAAGGLLGVAISHNFWRSHPTATQTQPGGGSGSSGFSFGNGGSGSSGSGGFPAGNGGSSGSSGSGGFPFGYSGGASSGGSSSSASGAPKDVSAIASKVDPALVDIDLTLGYGSGEAAATGIVMNSSGLVLTNNHVIDGATAISATDVGNGRTYKATVVGYDPDRDVALVQLHGASGLQTVHLGDSSEVAVHQAVVAIGNAGGIGGTPSAARRLDCGTQAAHHSKRRKRRHLRAVERPARRPTPTSSRATPVARWSTRPAKSSAWMPPLLMVTRLAPPRPHRPRASPSRSTPRCRSRGRSKIATPHPACTSARPRSLGSRLEGAGQGGFGGARPVAGAAIVGVLSGTPAAQAGLAAGDVIVSVNGRSVDSPTALTNAVDGHQPGDKVAIGWTDTTGGQHMRTMTLTSGPAH